VSDLEAPASGTVIDEFDVGDVHIVVRYGCTRRDQYDLRVPEPIAQHVRDALMQRGDAKDLGTLVVIEVPGVHQITAATERGRVVILPRMTRDRSLQRDDMLVVARILAER